MILKFHTLHYAYSLVHSEEDIYVATVNIFSGDDSNSSIPSHPLAQDAFTSLESDDDNPLAIHVYIQFRFHQSPPIPDVDVNQAFSSPPSNVNSPAPGHIFASNLDSAISVAEYPVAADIYLSSSDSHNAVAPTVDLIHLIFKCGETLENMFSSNW